MDIKEQIVAMVAEFQSFFDDNESTKNLAFRESLFNSEKAEYHKALEDDNKIEIADGLGDMLYVLAGSIDKFKGRDSVTNHFHNYFDSYYFEMFTRYGDEKTLKILTEIHRSNMSKACNTLEEAQLTILKYPHISDFRVLRKGDKYLIYCNADYEEVKKGKVLKSINYSPADLSFVCQ